MQVEVALFKAKGGYKETTKEEQLKRCRMCEQYLEYTNGQKDCLVFGYDLQNRPKWYECEPRISGNKRKTEYLEVKIEWTKISMEKQVHKVKAEEKALQKIKEQFRGLLNDKVELGL